jgi:thiazole synthase ThiGH ThiG subunit
VIANCAFEMLETPRQDPLHWERAMKLAVEAGWLAANAGRDRAEAARHGKLARSRG